MSLLDPIVRLPLPSPLPSACKLSNPPAGPDREYQRSDAMSCEGLVRTRRCWARGTLKRCCKSDASSATDAVFRNPIIQKIINDFLLLTIPVSLNKGTIYQPTIFVADTKCRVVPSSVLVLVASIWNATLPRLPAPLRRLHINCGQLVSFENVNLLHLDQLSLVKCDRFTGHLGSSMFPELMYLRIADCNSWNAPLGHFQKLKRIRLLRLPQFNSPVEHLPRVELLDMQDCSAWTSEVGCLGEVGSLQFEIVWNVNPGMFTLKKLEYRSMGVTYFNEDINEVMPLLRVTAIVNDVPNFIQPIESLNMFETPQNHIVVMGFPLRAGPLKKLKLIPPCLPNLSSARWQHIADVYIICDKYQLLWVGASICVV